MDNDDKITDMVFKAVQQVNQMMLGEQHIEEKLDTVLIGDASNLDSLAIVNLIVVLEASIQDEYDIPLNLADALAAAPDSNPFATIGALINHIKALVEENHG